MSLELTEKKLFRTDLPAASRLYNSKEIARGTLSSVAACCREGLQGRTHKEGNLSSAWEFCCEESGESTVPECFRCGKRNHTPDNCFHQKSRSQMSENGILCDKVHRYLFTTEATSQAWNNSKENKEARPNWKPSRR